MKQLTIQIPDGKFTFVVELLKRLSFVKFDTSEVETVVLTEEQKLLIDEELRKIKSEPGYLMDWSEAKKRLRFG